MESEQRKEQFTGLDFEQVSEEEGFKLLKATTKGPEPEMPEVGMVRDWHIYTLVHPKGEKLLQLTCAVPTYRDREPDLYYLGKLFSLKKGNMRAHFSRLIDMMRADLRRAHPGCDVADWYPSDYMKEYYKELGAKKTKKGFHKFPDPLSKAVNRKR